MFRSALLLSAFVFATACSSAPPAEMPPDADVESADAGEATDGGAADAGATSSRGHGGITCTSRSTVTANNVTYGYCVATVAGVDLKIVEPASGGEGPLRLAVYLHGDGAGPYNSGLALRTLAPWTSTHRTLLVAARAPNACAWWLKPSYTTCDGVTPVPESAKDTSGENAKALSQAIDALRGGWDLADSPVLFGGSSGGAIFLTGSFLPLYGARFPGAYALSCGGDTPWSGMLVGNKSHSALPAATRLFFTYGDKDFLVPDIEKSIGFYEGAGVPTEVKVVAETGAAGSSHCGNVGGSYSYDQIGRVSEVWGIYSAQ